MYGRGGAQLGENRIEAILDGHAYLEHWRSAAGAGKSLFYWSPEDREWRQTWVTSAGAVKEKRLVERLHDGGVRFQGVVAGRVDRTTLRPLGDGRVVQLIEVSEDDGQTWSTSFEGTYIRD